MNPPPFSDMPNIFQNPETADSNSTGLRKAVFLDRDGVINKEVHYLHKVEDFELLEKSAEAISAINQAEFLAIIVTNQSVVARNLCSLAELETIHQTMQTLLGKKNATLDAIFYCPHHPDKTLAGGRGALTIPCRCRKPDIGMIEQATEKFGIDLKHSFMVGDSPRDIECGQRAGVTTIAVHTGQGWQEASVSPDYFADNLYEAVQIILKKEAPSK